MRKEKKTITLSDGRIIKVDFVEAEVKSDLLVNHTSNADIFYYTVFVLGDINKPATLYRPYASEPFPCLEKDDIIYVNAERVFAFHNQNARGEDSYEFSRYPHVEFIDSKK